MAVSWELSSALKHRRKVVSMGPSARYYNGPERTLVASYAARTHTLSHTALRKAYIPSIRLLASVTN